MGRIGGGMERGMTGNDDGNLGNVSIPKRFGKAELEEARRQLESLSHKLRGVVRTLESKGSDGKHKAQITLARRRVAALDVASELIGRALERFSP